MVMFIIIAVLASIMFFVMRDRDEAQLNKQIKQQQKAYMKKLKAGKEQTRSFEFHPRLANGDYYLVVALEDRENTTIAYYEYIEGADYFKAYSDKKIFGIYDVPAIISCQ